MEYFRISLSKEIRNPLRVKGLDPNYYKHNINRQEFKRLEKMLVTYVEYSEDMVVPEVLTRPTFLISEQVKRIFQTQDENISYKGIQLYPENEEDAEKFSKVYWIPDSPFVECLDREVKILPNGTIDKLLLNERKVGERNIFRIAGIQENITIVSLKIAEKLIQNKLYGVAIEEVQMR